MSDDRYTEGFGDGVIDRQPWLARAEAAEARCKRLTELLRELTGWSDKQIEEGVASDFGVALSDTAQQETPPPPPYYWQRVEERKGAADMRERAAKLVEDRYPLDDGEALDLAEDIRSLPIDPETGTPHQEGLLNSLGG